MMYSCKFDKNLTSGSQDITQIKKWLKIVSFSTNVTLKLGLGYQNLISSFPCPNDVPMQIL